MNTARHSTFAEVAELVAKLRFSDERADYRTGPNWTVYAHPWIIKDEPDFFRAQVRVTPRRPEYQGRSQFRIVATQGEHVYLPSGLTNSHGDTWFRLLPNGRFQAGLRGMAAAPAGLPEEIERLLPLGEPRPSRTAEPGNVTVLQRALPLAERIADARCKSEALAAIAERLAAAGGEPQPVFQRALAAAESVDDEWTKSEALTLVGRRLAAAGGDADPIFRRAVASAEKIPHGPSKTQALLAIPWREAAYALAAASAQPEEPTAKPTVVHLPDRPVVAVIEAAPSDHTLLSFITEDQQQAQASLSFKLGPLKGKLHWQPTASGKKWRSEHELKLPPHTVRDLLAGFEVTEAGRSSRTSAA